MHSCTLRNEVVHMAWYSQSTLLAIGSITHAEASSFVRRSGRSRPYWRIATTKGTTPLALLPDDDVVGSIIHWFGVNSRV